jgi:hypothetical protein
VTAEQEAARAALDGLRRREASGGRIAQSAMAEAIRRATEADLAARHVVRSVSGPRE